ncbi:MAG: hypothetical protein WCD70_03515 [Alphaproteobacteria bacterium]
MAIFTVLSVEQSEPLNQKILAEFSEANYRISPMSWLVSFKGTSEELSKKLGLLDPTSNLRAVITRVESYHGRAPAPIWEWIKTKWEAAQNG